MPTDQTTNPADSWTEKVYFCICRNCDHEWLEYISHQAEADPNYDEWKRVLCPSCGEDLKRTRLLRVKYAD